MLGTNDQDNALEYAFGSGQYLWGAGFWVLGIRIWARLGTRFSRRWICVDSTVNGMSWLCTVGNIQHCRRQPGRNIELSMTYWFVPACWKLARQWIRLAINRSNYASNIACTVFLSTSDKSQLMTWLPSLSLVMRYYVRCKTPSIRVYPSRTAETRIKSLLRNLPSVPLFVDFPTSFDFVNFFLPQASATAHRHLHNLVQPVVFILPWKSSRGTRRLG